MPIFDGMREADVVINGVALTFGQSMTLRVAVSSMCMMLANPDYARGIGEELARLYAARAAEIERLLVENPGPLTPPAGTP